MVGGTEIKDRVEEIKRSGRGEPISVDQQGLLHPPIHAVSRRHAAPLLGEDLVDLGFIHPCMNEVVR